MPWPKFLAVLIFPITSLMFFSLMGPINCPKSKGFTSLLIWYSLKGLDLVFLLYFETVFAFCAEKFVHSLHNLLFINNVIYGGPRVQTKTFFSKPTLSFQNQNFLFKTKTFFSKPKLSFRNENYFPNKNFLFEANLSFKSNSLSSKHGMWNMGMKRTGYWNRVECKMTHNYTKNDSTSKVSLIRNSYSYGVSS